MEVREHDISSHRPAIESLCRRHRVRTLHVFGSVLTDRFREDSDVDMVVEFEPLDPLEYVDHYFDLKFELEDLLQREVDLLEKQAIRNPFLQKSIDEQKELLYDNRNQSLAG